VLELHPPHPITRAHLSWVSQTRDKTTVAYIKQKNLRRVERDASGDIVAI
jgi:hypothetical protein